MYSKLLTLPMLAMLLTLFTACGGGGGSSTSIINGIPDKYKIVKGKPTLELDALTDGTVKSNTWKIDDVIVSQKAKDTIDLHLAVGSHKICLTLVDDKDKTKTECKDIEVVESSLNKPTAVINILNNSSEIKTACPIKISASESIADQNGEIVKYEWFKNSKPFGDGKATQEFESNSTGDINITLKVTDNEYNSDSKTIMIKVLPHTGPTIKLTMLNPLQQKVFSLETNQNINIGAEDSDKNLPYRGSFIFLSAAGSYDDCNLTDDNLTYIWDGRIYVSSTGITKKSSCFSSNPWLKDVHRDFNTTGEIASQAFAKRTDIENVPSDYGLIIDENRYNSAKYIYPYVEGRSEGVGGPYVYFPTCSPPHYNEYDRLEITLTVKDNLHGTQTTVTKSFKIQP
jgi:galactitol-specific phosphotransferase system IIB component